MTNHTTPASASVHEAATALLTEYDRLRGAQAPAPLFEALRAALSQPAASQEVAPSSAGALHKALIDMLEQFERVDFTGEKKAVIERAYAALDRYEVCRPDIIERLSYHAHERDDLTLDECLDVVATGWSKVHGRSERQMVMQIMALLAGQPAALATSPAQQGYKMQAVLECIDSLEAHNRGAANYEGHVGPIGHTLARLRISLGLPPSPPDAPKPAQQWAAVPVERDEDGYWMHPGLPWDDIPEDADCTPWISKWGFVPAFVSMEFDAADELMDRYMAQNSADCSYWTPTQPEGDDWFLAAIYDTEEGPYAMFLRPAPQADQGGGHG